MDQITGTVQARRGRPTKEEAEARQEQLLECAIDHFLERGYERATVEAIAADVSMTKRTVYAKYEDKAALFHAAVYRAIDRFAPAAEAIESTSSGDLEQTLTNIAMLRIDLIGTRDGVRLQQIINVESYRFPEIFTRYYEVAAKPTVDFLKQVLVDATARGELVIDRPGLAANTFMSMVVGGPVRFITSGNALPRAKVEDQVGFAVRLFLDGARTRNEGVSGR
ncbi:MAG: TetR/AcrR family transcriptional regulator [Sphingomonadaceae bacterium]